MKEMTKRTREGELPVRVENSGLVDLDGDRGEAVFGSRRADTGGERDLGHLAGRARR